MPTCATLKILKRELSANAMAIPSTHGGGAHGHLALIMPATDYLTLTGQAFDVPVHPRNAPEHTVGATAAQITEDNRLYKAAIWNSKCI